MQTTAPSIKKNGTRTRPNSSTGIQAAAQGVNPGNLELQARLEALNKVQSVIEFELDGTIVAANENFLKTVGYSLAEIQGRHHSLFVEPGQAASAEYKQLWRALAGGQSQTGEFKWVAKDGKEASVQASYTPILDAAGRPCKVVGSVTDISESVRLRAAAEELKIRTDIMNLTCIVSEADLKGDIVWCNDKFCETSQYKREELVGKGHNTTRHPDMPKEVFKQLWATIGRGEIFRGVVKNRKKDGTPYYVDAVIAPVLGANGKPRKYLGVRYDITESELDRQNARGIIEAINSAFAFIEFNPKGEIITANARFLKVMGYELNEITGRHHRMFVESTVAASPAYTQFWADMNAGQTKVEVFRRVTKDGRELYLQATYAPVRDEMGRVQKIVKLATDVTAQKLAEANLQKTLDAVAQNASTLSSASEELSANSTLMVSNAEETATQAGVVSAAAEQVSKNVQTVATGTEEMGASIKEIAKNAQDAAKVAAGAVKTAETTNATISKLGDSSAEIGKVIKVITSIAQQTNLLALNATIEAARAGEAGKGFAVVANEVKELAKETAKATEDISQKIEAIQGDTKSAVTAIAEISAIINKINDYQNTIASAVEEQTATTNEISRNVAEAAKGSTEIAMNITGVATAAKSTTAGANDTQKAADELSRMASELQAIVNSSQNR